MGALENDAKREDRGPHNSRSNCSLNVLRSKGTLRNHNQLSTLFKIILHHGGQNVLTTIYHYA